MLHIAGGRRVWIGAVAVGLAVFAAGLAVWRSRPAVDSATAYRGEVAAQGQRLYKRFNVEPILGERDLVRETVSRAPRSKFAVDTNAPLDPLFDLYADFVYYRFGQPDVEVYKQWRLDHGYRWRSMQDLIDIWMVEEGFAMYMPNSQFPEHPTPEGLFDEFWTFGLDWHADVNRPVAICTEEDGFARIDGNRHAGQSAGWGQTWRG